MMGTKMAASVHIPVMVRETIEALAIQPGGRYIDCTLGSGGHARAILEYSSPGGQLLGIDADPEAINVARERLADYGESVLLINDNFVNLKTICTKYGFHPVHGILFDLGLSSLQLEKNGGGFSFQHDAPLDMRLNPSSQEITAAQIVNTYPVAKLAEIIKTYGEERQSFHIARQIVQERPIKSTLHLAQIIEKAVGGRKGRLHPATKTFQALRIVVNRELSHLQAALNQAISLLGFKGRLVVISYHSLEDRIVKQFMQRESQDCICSPSTPVCICGHKTSLRIITKKVSTPAPEEIRLNPRSRSAKLRAAECLTIPQEQYEISNQAIPYSYTNEEQGWRKPVLAEKVRKMFLAIQVETF